MLRRVEYAHGEANVDRRIWRRVVDDVGNHIGYQQIDGRTIPKPSAEQSRASLAAPEMKAMAGELGHSRTAGMSDQKRALRIHPKSGRLMPEEDFVERVRQKVGVWHECVKGRDDRAVRVYPKAPPSKTGK